MDDALRAAGIAGVLLSTGIGFSDVILLVGARPVARPTFDAMTTVPSWRLILGGTVGAALLPLMALTMWHVYRGLAPASPWLAIPPPTLLAYFLCTGSALHFAFPFVGLVLHERDRKSVGESDIAKRLYGRFRAAFTPLACVSGAAFVGGSLWLAAAILSGTTSYPRWFVIMNPLLIASVALCTRGVLPNRTASVLTAAFVHVGFVPFMAGSTIVLWNRG